MDKILRGTLYPELVLYRILSSPVILKKRFSARKKKNFWSEVENFDVGEIPQNKGLNRCQCYYINLSHRLDRKIKIEAEFHKIGFTGFNRFEAFMHPIAGLGCTLSHKEILKSVKINPEQILMVCEDDCEFLVGRDVLDRVIEEFVANPCLDVLCLAYRIPHSQKPISIGSNLAVTSNIQTMACYLLKPHMQKEMLSMAEKSEQRYNAGFSPLRAAIDQVWKILQLKYIFAIPNQRVARQRASYSDIENSFKDYRV